MPNIFSFELCAPENRINLDFYVDLKIKSVALHANAKTNNQSKAMFSMLNFFYRPSTSQIKEVKST